MKNFRKVLALVLVVAMMFSFAAMAGAKELKDYTDAESVSYGTAVEILSALEILNGYEDDTFRPTNSISREEMAKMIAILANAGDADVDSLYAAACEFADVEKDRWSASYISYCAYTGIVAGVGENCFNPYGNVTALETAKMLLVLMGFDADEQGYVGANWKINVLRDMQNFGLTAGFPAGYDWNDNISREEAAQMMLNALQSNVVVGILSENIVKITNALYQGWGIEATLIDAQKRWDISMYGNVIVDGDTTLGEALYGDRLDMDVNVRDCYGRPGTIWTLIDAKGKTILKGSFVANPLYVPANTDGTIKLADVIEAASNVKGATVHYFVDGEYINDTQEYNDLVKIGKGVQVEVYANGAGTVIDVIIINTFIGEITNETTGYYVVNDGNVHLSKKAYTFAKGDVVLYWLCAEGHDGKTFHTTAVHAAKAPTVETTGIKTASELKDYAIGTNGTTYGYAANMGKNLPATTTIEHDEMNATEVNNTKNGATYDLYLDEFGYIMGYKVTATPAAPVYYAYAVEGTGFYDVHGYTGAGAARFESEKDIVKVEDASAATVDVLTPAAWEAMNARYEDAAITGWNDYKDSILGTLVAYTVNADGAVATAAAAPYWLDTKYPLMPNIGQDYSIENGYVPMVKANGDVVYADKDGREMLVAYGAADTQYLVRTYDYASGAYVYTTYTEDTLPSGFLGYTWIDSNDDGEMDFTVGTIQMFATEMDDRWDTLIADVVFIDAIYGTAPQTRAFVTSTKVDHFWDTDFIDQFAQVDIYEAVIGGEEGYIVINDADDIAADLSSLQLYSAVFSVIGYTVDGDPIYLAATEVAPTTEGEALRYVRGELFYEGVLQDVDENCFVVVAFPAGYNNDTTLTYDILEEGITGINKFYMAGSDLSHAEDCTVEGCEGCVYGYGWVIDADGDGDVDELYFEVWATGRPQA